MDVRSAFFYPLPSRGHFDFSCPFDQMAPGIKVWASACEIDGARNPKNGGAHVTVQQVIPIDEAVLVRVWVDAVPTNLPVTSGRSDPGVEAPVHSEGNEMAQVVGLIEHSVIINGSGGDHQDYTFNDQDVSAGSPAWASAAEVNAQTWNFVDGGAYITVQQVVVGNGFLTVRVWIDNVAISIPVKVTATSAIVTGP
jgi:hypothetical protein